MDGLEAFIFNPLNHFIWLKNFDIFAFIRYHEEVMLKALVLCVYKSPTTGISW